MEQIKWIVNKPLLPSFGLVVIIGTHLYLTFLGDPFGVTFDLGLWVAASILKLIVLLALLQTLLVLYQRFAEAPYRAVVFSTVFALLLTGAILFLSQQREMVARIFSDAATKYYPPTGVGISDP